MTAGGDVAGGFGALGGAESGTGGTLLAARADAALACQATVKKHNEENNSK